MTIDRESFNGPIVFECDARRCPETLETHCTHFASAKAKLDAYGWKTRNAGGEWQHLCPSCAEEITK